MKPIQTSICPSNISSDSTAYHSQTNFYKERAKQLHSSIPVIDAHNDLAGELLLRHQHGERDVIRRLYLPHWKASGFQLIVSSIYIENAVFYPRANSDLLNGCSQLHSTFSPNTEKTWNDYWNDGTLCWEQGFENALAQIEVIKEEIQELSQEICLITTKRELEEIKGNQKIGILLYMEGLDCIGSDLDKIHILYQLGVRGASLTWSRPNLLATGCCTATKFQDIPGQITHLGYRAIQELQRHGMFLDISHLNNEGWEQVNNLFSNQQAGKEASSAPFLPYIATHSDAYSIYPNYRNLTDNQMQALAKQGGIMGFNACKYIVGYSGTDTGSNSLHCLDAMCCHIEYAVELIGASHVGLGFDLCDSYTRGKYQNENIEPEDCLENHKKALLLTSRLLERGMPEQTVLRIIGLNWLEYFEHLLH
ncbi:MAG: membrane dipeptidase [Lachnospiraceae bacterium]|nr:membrane dipeptidase [Lachnospiraceae bacterium]